MTWQWSKVNIMNQPISAVLLMIDGEELSACSSLLTSFGLCPRVCHTYADALPVLMKEKVDLVVVDFDIEKGAEVLNLNPINACGYRAMVIALGTDIASLAQPLTKQLHSGVRKPLTDENLIDALTSAVNLIAIEKRASFRHAMMIASEVSVVQQGTLKHLPRGKMLDLSRTGTCIQLKAALTKGTSVFINFELPDQSLIHAQGQVVWSDVHGCCGIRFDNIPTNEFKRMRNYLDSRCPWSRYLRALSEQPRQLNLPRDKSQLSVGSAW